MILFKKSSELSEFLKKERSKGRKIGFVPTMGALHGGHISLIETSLKEKQVTLSSIFVNPTQFNDPKDFEKYPKTPEKDIDLLESSGCDVLFLPGVAEVYPQGIAAKQQYKLGYLETILEGKYRPGHFQGVCQVVHRLLDIVKPDTLYVGQKDFQQCLVIKKLAELIGSSVQIKICPTQREKDGLAMSSRNARLSTGHRKQASQIYVVLSGIKNNIAPGPLAGLEQDAVQNLTRDGFRVDYVEIAKADDLGLPESWDGNTKMVALAAAYLDNVRLIDNLLLN